MTASGQVAGKTCRSCPCMSCRDLQHAGLDSGAKPSGSSLAPRCLVDKPCQARSTLLDNAP